MGKVLVLCEFSGTVRDAFRARGHDAISVDLLPSDRPGPHIVGDALEALETTQGVDLVIAHPPCTYLANSGVRWLYGGKGTERDPERWAQMREAAYFFSRLLLAPVPRVAVENPVMHGYARALIEDAAERAGRSFHRQTVQPWQFGHGETKATQLWLRNLPPLTPTDVVDGREHRVHRMPPGPNRWAERSKTFQGIADAMAEQWGELV